jgi:hypothetical protein
MHDPVPGSRGLKKTVPAIPLPVNGAVLPAVEALEFDEMDPDLLIQQQVHMYKISREDQIIVYRGVEFGLHFS